MPRPPRLVVPDIAMHVRQRGNDGQACFRHESDRLVYLLSLHELCGKARCALHAYCLMTNHVHLLLTPPDERACATLMRDLGQRYVQYFNRRYRRTGTLWEGRYRSCLVDSREYVLGCYRYIELNPVRAGIASSPTGYRWSSYCANIGAGENKLLTPHPEYLALADRPDRRQNVYQGMFDDGNDSALVTAIRAATYGGHPLVGEQLKRQLAGEGRRVEPGKAGRRPRREQAPDEVASRSLELGL
jgi:putative transposase